MSGDNNSDGDKQGEQSENSLINNTDYNFPDMWGLMSKEEKSRWYTQERCRRQAMRQDTTFAKRMRRQEDESSDTE